MTTAVAAGSLLIWLAPPALVLPAFSVAALVGASLAALLAWWTKAKRHADRITLWDIAGALAFIGFGAAMLTEPADVVRLFRLTTSAA